MIKSALTLTLLLTLAGEAQAADSATAVFVDHNGEEIGKAHLTQTPNGVLIRVDLVNLPPGEHGFHVHEIGRCDPADGFQSAGGHYGPQERQHGLEVDRGPHAGDMTNQIVDANGRLQAEILNARVSLENGRAPLLDRDGSALMVHAGPDDYESQPSGNAGDRIACAVVKPA